MRPNSGAWHNCRSGRIYFFRNNCLMSRLKKSSNGISGKVVIRCISAFAELWICRPGEVPWWFASACGVQPSYSSIWLSAVSRISCFKILFYKFMKYILQNRKLFVDSLLVWLDLFSWVAFSYSDVDVADRTCLQTIRWWFPSVNVVDKAGSFGECKDLNEVLVERIREQKVRNSDKIPRKTLPERK